MSPTTKAEARAARYSPEVITFEGFMTVERLVFDPKNLDRNNYEIWKEDLTIVLLYYGFYEHLTWDSESAASLSSKDKARISAIIPSTVDRKFKIHFLQEQRKMVVNDPKDLWEEIRGQAVAREEYAIHQAGELKAEEEAGRRDGLF